MLVDTSAWVDYFNGHPSTEAQRLAHAIADNQPIVLPGVVLTEILLGLKSEAEAERIASLLTAFDAAPSLDHADYLAAAVIYRSCRAQGYTVRSTIDCLIARLCLRHDFTLLTKDRDFQAIARFFPLRLVTAN
ncbi:MAG: PIN domain nuclease [Sulfuricellaceae bacterium]